MSTSNTSFEVTSSKDGIDSVRVVSDAMSLRLAKLVLGAIAINPELIGNVVGATANAEATLSKLRVTAGKAHSEAASDMGKIAVKGDVQAITEHAQLITQLSVELAEAESATADSLLSGFQLKLQSDQFKTLYCAKFGKVKSTSGKKLDHVLAMSKYDHSWIYVPELNEQGEPGDNVQVYTFKDDLFLNVGKVTQDSISGLHPKAAELVGLTSEQGDACKAQAKNGSSDLGETGKAHGLLSLFTQRHPEIKEELERIAAQ